MLILVNIYAFVNSEKLLQYHFSLVPRTVTVGPAAGLS